MFNATKKQISLIIYSFNFSAHLILYWHTWGYSLSQHALGGWQDTGQVASPSQVEHRQEDSHSYLQAI